MTIIRVPVAKGWLVDAVRHENTGTKFSMDQDGMLTIEDSDGNGVEIHEDEVKLLRVFLAHHAGDSDSGGDEV